MRSFRKPMEEDFLKYKDIYDKGESLFGFIKEESIIMSSSGKESIIFYCQPVFMKFYMDEKGNIETSSFYASEDKIEAFTLGEYQININGNGLMFIHEDGNIYYLELIGNNEDVDFDVSNNGVVVFSQYNKKKDVRVVSKYEHNVWNDRREIYGMRLENPFSVVVESLASKRDRGLKFLGHKSSYYKLDFDVYKNRWQYDIATIKEFGVGAVLAGDTYSLQDKESFSKYYKVLLAVSDYITITGFPFTRQYDVRNIEGIFIRLGFTMDVPEYFLNIYNSKDCLNDENEEILKWYLLNIKDDKKLSKIDK